MNDLHHNLIARLSFVRAIRQQVMLDRIAEDEKGNARTGVLMFNVERKLADTIHAFNALTAHLEKEDK